MDFVALSTRKSLFLNALCLFREGIAYEADPAATRHGA
jgi:hypothetical protein